MFLIFYYELAPWPHIALSVRAPGTWLVSLTGLLLMSIAPVLAIAKFKRRVAQDRIKLEKQARALRAYGQAALALAQAKTAGEIAERVCAALVQELPYVLAMMTFADDGPQKPVRIVSKAGPAAGYAEGLRLSWSDEIPEGRGSTGIAIRSGQPVAIRDMLTDPMFAHWRSRAEPFKMRSSVTVPFNRDGLPRGAFLVYATVPDAFGPDEIDLFTNLGNAISFAFVAFADRARLDAETLRLQRLIDAAYNPIVSVDGNGLIAAFNRAAQMVFGYRFDEVVGRQLDMLIPEKHAAAHGAHVRGFLAGNETGRQMSPKREVFGRRKNGETFPIEVAITRVENIDGPFSTAIIHDLTERKSFEQKLVQSAKMEAFGQLAGGIAHDFNNILAVIITYAGLVKDNVDPTSPENVAVRKIENAAQRGTELIRRMMSVARREPSPVAQVNVSHVLEDVIAMIRVGLGKNIAVTFDCPEADLCAAVNRAELHTSLLNLAFNARDAMPNGGHLDLALRRASRQGEVDGATSAWLEIVLTDSGAGIEPDALEKIFEPFYTSKEPGKGTGLGLSMVKRFVDESGGEIRVTSAAGRGTTFIMRLPEADLVSMQVA
jgi:PAS domain S-box-containing protein